MRKQAWVKLGDIKRDGIHRWAEHWSEKSYFNEQDVVNFVELIERIV